MAAMPLDDQGMKVLKDAGKEPNKNRAVYLLPASTQFDSHMQLIAATQLRKGDVAFGISCSGATSETVRCLEVARSRGARTICLTSEIKYFQAPLASRITQLAIVDALFVSLAQKNKDRTAIQLRNAGEELLKQRMT